MDVAKLGIEVSSKGTSQATAELAKLTNAAKMAEQAVEGLSSKQNSSRAALAAAKGYQSQSAAALAAARASGTASQEDIKSAQAAYQKARAVTAAAKADLDAVSASLAAAKADQQQANAALKAAQAITQATTAANDNASRLTSSVGRMGGSMSGLAAQAQDVIVTASMGMNAGMVGLQQGTQIAGQVEAAMQGGAKASTVFATAFASLLSPVTLVSIALTTVAAASLQMVNWSGLAASALNGLADVLQTIAPYAATAAAGLALLYAPAIIGGTVQLIALLGRLSVAALGLAASFAAANPAIAFVAGITAAVAAANIFRDELTQIFGVDIVGAAKTGVNFVIGSFIAAFEDIKFVWNNLPNVVGAAAVGAANAVIRAVNHIINGAKMAINDLISAINLIPGVDIGALDTSGGTIGELENSFAAGLSEGVAARNAAVQAALSHDYVGQIGGAIQTAASAGKTALKDLAASISGVGAEGEKAGGRAAGGMDKVKAATDRANQSMDEAKGVVKGFLSDLRSGLTNGEGFWKSFGNAALNVLDKIIGKIEDQLVDALFSVGSASSGATGGGGIFGALFSGIGKIFGFARGGYTGNRAASAAAGVVHGQEYVFNARATRNIGVGNLEAMHKAANRGYSSGGYVAPAPANQNSGGGQVQRLQVSFVPQVDRSGNLTALITDVSEQSVQKAAPGIVSAANQQVVPTMARHQANKAGADWRS